MDKELTYRYYVLFEQLVDAMTDGKGIEIEQIYSALEELCKLFRLSKGVAKYYRSAMDEKSGQGEMFVCFDNDLGGKEVYRKRLVSRSMTVAECIVYMPDSEAPLTEDETEKVDLIMRTVLFNLTRNRHEAVIEKLTFYDDTGYPNSRAFFRYLSERDRDGTLSKYAAVRYNLRHFSLINQEVGRHFGDIVLRKHFDLLKSTVGERGIVCRLGGDNFLMMIEKPLLGKAVDILKGTPILYDLNRTKRVMVIADTGIFEIPDGFRLTGYDEIMDRIVAAITEAKTGGKETIVYFDDKMVVGKEARNRIQQSFPKAMSEKEFKVFYQPKVDISTGELVGAEALCRWFHNGEIIPPSEFIPVLEEGMMICSLDFYMLNEVCGDIRRWLDEGRKVVRISVNLSRKHMMDIDLIERITGIVKGNNVPPEYVEIELTETTTDVEFRDLKRVVSSLQQAGIYTSVDDFGMGYSSLNLIREIPWNVLKVDRSFLPIEEDNKESNRSIMFKYVVAMAKEMGLECIAEGVETRKQVDVLGQNSCAYAQGFFFDRPLPVDEFENRLDKHHYDLETGRIDE